MTSQIFTKSKAMSGSGQPEVYVAAFGKHPAWNDFIDDPGLETERLVGIKRVLYLEGIAAAIETGSWDKLEAAQRTEGFGHLIVWRTRGEIVVCRLWSSSDGKGRTKYPMVVVAQCRGVSLAWVLTEALPRLDRLERRCREATSQDQVRAALDATRSELRARAAVAEGGGPIQSTAIAAVADELEMSSGGSGRDSFYRLMYQVERDWGVFLARRSESTTSTRSLSSAMRPQHARVPSGGGTLEQGLTRWMHFVLNLVDTATSVTLIREIGERGEDGWTDIIVGEPEGGQFFCIRASDQSLPLATSIPYTIDTDFKSRCDRLIDDSRCGRLGAESPEVVTKTSLGLLERVKSLLGGKKKGLLVLLIAGGLVGMGVAIALMSSGSGSGAGGNGKEERTRAETPREHPPPTTPAQTGPAIAPAEAGEWGRLCMAYRDWFAEFVQRLQKRPPSHVGEEFKTRADYYATDPYLGVLIAKLRSAEASGRGIDPWSIAGVPKSRDLADLAANPPASVAEAATVARITEALDIIDGFSTKLASDWPELKQFKEAARLHEQSGDTALAAFLRSLVAGVEVRSAGGPGAGIDDILATSRLINGYRPLAMIVNQTGSLAGQSGDPLLRRFPEWVEQNTPSRSATSFDLTTLEDLSREWERAAEVARPLGEFLEREWTKTDTELLAKRVAASSNLTSGKLSRESFMEWLELARATPRFDAASDPRRAAGLEEMTRRVRESRERLEKEFGAAPNAKLAELDASTAAAVEALLALPFNAETERRISAESGRLAGALRELKQGLDNAVAVETAKRAGSAREVRENLTKQESIVARSDTINTAWRSGRDKVLAATSDAEYAQIVVRTDALRDALVALDAEVAPGLDGSEPGAIQRAASGASWAARERALAGALKDWVGIEGDPKGAALASAGTRAAAAFTRERAEIEAFVRDLRIVGERVGAGASLSEKTGTGEPLASLVERCRRSALLQDATLSAVARPVLRDAESLERIEQLVGARELVEAADAALPAQWPTALAAWRRLGRLTSPAWPDSLASLRREEALSERLLQAVGAGAGARRSDLEREIHEQRAARWERAFAVLVASAEIEAAAGLAADMGVTREGLTGATRYNLELALLRRAALAGTLTEEQARERARRFEREVESLDAGVGTLPGVVQLMERLGPISGRREEPEPRVDVTRLGPGSAHGGLAGFTGTVDGPVLRFSRAGAAALTLSFVRVDAPGAETFFLATTELSLAQFIGIVEAAGAWKEMASLFTSTDPADDFRRGPCVWRWTQDEHRDAVMRVSDKWLRELATGRSVLDVPRTLTPGEPTEHHPMNYVPPEAAMFVAHLVGCRLPTLQEWRAAASAINMSENPERFNLRDRQWKLEQAHINELARAGSVNWPDDDIYLPVRRGGGGPSFKIGPDGGARAWDDGVLWFAPVGAGGADASVPAHHLVGNVAEIVVEAGAGEVLPAPGGPSAAGARAIVGRLRESLRVVGGSALSPVEMDPLEPQILDLNEAIAGYADVGCRLTFSAAGAGPVREPLGAQLAKAVAEASYILNGAGE